MSNILAKQGGTTLLTGTLVTTAETQILYSGRVYLPFQSIRSIIKCWVQVIGGTAITTLTARIRKGNGITGTEVGTPQAMQFNAGAGNCQEFSRIVSETLNNVEFADYSLTLTQAAATGNGTVANAAMEVDIING